MPDEPDGADEDVSDGDEPGVESVGESAEPGSDPAEPESADGPDSALDDELEPAEPESADPGDAVAGVAGATTMLRPAAIASSRRRFFSETVIAILG